MSWHCSVAILHCFRKKFQLPSARFCVRGAFSNDSRAGAKQLEVEDGEAPAFAND